MDFRTCPSCKASVLEDDVAECPFCGASMSGKPSAAAKAKPAAPGAGTKPNPANSGATGTPAKPGNKPTAAAGKTEQSAGAPAAKPVGGPGKPAGRPVFGQTTADEENPFDIDTKSVKKAATVSPKSVKGKTHEVTCPMCDTKGYVAAADIGKDAKCCNPDCKFPYFKVLPPPRKEVVVEQVKKGPSVLVLGLLGLVVIGGGIAAFAFLKKPEEKPPVVDVNPQAAPQIDKGELVQEGPREVARKEYTPAEFRDLILSKIDVPAKSNDKNRSRAIRLQYAIEGHADAHDLAGANALLSNLKIDQEKGNAFHQIQPLVRIALQHLAAGDMAEAGKQADAALKHVDVLPGNDRQSLDAVASLCALLVQLNRGPETIPLLTKYTEISPKAEVSMRGVASALWTGSIESKNYNLHYEASLPHHVSMSSPLWVSVVEAATARGAVDQALAFCQSKEIPQVDARDACYAGWACRMAGQAGLAMSDAQSRIEQAILGHSLGPVTQARMWLAVASHLALSGNKDDAAKMLEKGTAALTAAGPQRALPLPSMKSIYDNRDKYFAGLPDPAPARSRTLAETGLVLVQLQLGNADAAAASLEKAMQAARAQAPSKSQTQALVDACRTDRAGLQVQLQSTLNLRNPNATQLERVFGIYRGRVDRLHEQAEARFNLEVDILRAAVEAGLHEPVWKLVQSIDGNSDPALQQPLMTSDVPGLVAERAFLAGNRTLAQAIAPLFKQPPHRVDVLVREMEERMNAKDLKAAADRIDAAYSQGLAKTYSQRIDLELLKGLGRRPASIEPSKMLAEFVIFLRDPLLREDLVRQLGATSVQGGTGSAVWETMLRVEVAPKLGDADKVALMRGMLEIPVAPPAALASP